VLAAMKLADIASINTSFLRVMMNPDTRMSRSAAHLEAHDRDDAFSFSAERCDTVRYDATVKEQCFAR